MSESASTAASSPDPDQSTAKSRTGGVKSVRVLGLIVAILGVVFIVAGATTYILVGNTLADEKITVSEDADYFAGQPVNDPWTAYSEAQTIEKHALEAADGKTYAELDRDDPTRDTVMTGSFLRASLFTSVVAFGVAALVVGLGVGMILIGWALLKLGRVTAVV